MKTKGELTREMIIRRAARVFNQRGYSGTSIADLVEETGLERGGIYNHFRNKDELALAAFEYAASLRGKHLRDCFQRIRLAPDRLIGAAEVFLDMLENPELPGGCPVLNTAVEADDTHPELKARAQIAMDDLRGMIEQVVKEGLERGEIKPQTNPRQAATMFIALLEGGLMMSKLYDDTSYLQQVVAFLSDYIDAQLRL